MKFLLQDLRFGLDEAKPTPKGNRFDRKACVDLLDYAIPHAPQDVAVIFINCIGMRRGRREQQNFQRQIRATEIFGRTWPAIELTTAAGVCGMVELHRTGKLPTTGLVKQEDCSLTEFNNTVFGLGYEGPGRIEAAVKG
jgi:saccharopine dehydrogenase-like NADP-dependent oxidoreductase